MNLVETLQIPARKSHTMWNASDEKTILNWKVYPAMKTENFLETVVGLATTGKTNGTGMPGTLQIAMTANKYSDEFRLARPSFPVMKILFMFLTPLGFLVGKRADDQGFFD